MFLRDLVGLFNPLCCFVSLLFFLLICCFQVIAENLSEEEIEGLRQTFNHMDTARTGTITYEELKTGLARLGSRLKEEEIRQLMDAVRNLELSNFISFACGNH